MTINGLPAHVLLVHAVVVLLPLSALLVVLVAVWPAARNRFAAVTVLIAAVTAVLVPITTEAGEWLEHRVPRTALLHVHTRLGDDVLPWAIGLAIVAIALYARYRVSLRRYRSAHPPSDDTTVDAVSVHQLGGAAGTVGLAVIAIVVSFGATYVIYQVGESGSRAAWTNRFSPTPLSRIHTATPAPTRG